MGEVVKKLTYSCPFCDTVHEISVIKDKTQALVHNTPVEYEGIFYYCSIEDDKFSPKEIVNQNLLAAKDSYRALNGLLTSYEIKEARALYEVNQKEFANMLGWGDVTIQRYENKSIQDETYDQKLRFVRDNPKLAIDELERHKDKFDQARYKEIRGTISDFVETKSVRYLYKEIIESLYMEYKEESHESGYKKLDLEKTLDMIAFFAQHNSGLDKVKLTKLLWYADFLFCKKYGIGMSGQVYKHVPLGVVPIAYDEILKYAQTHIVVSEAYVDDTIVYNVLPKQNVNLSKFSIDEISVLQAVLKKFDKLGSKSMLDYVHKEIPYQATSDGETIPYNLAKEINDF
ncbi:type II TA system antitoxin MqsA family protein [Virgibacillus flavescens]|uniref:type II TA system antitoxin MqsA family protein n=1 Tax=Virgibacillus flavescens TaxID=1611422 RepID=UPI003D332A3A